MTCEPMGFHVISVFPGKVLMEEAPQADGSQDDQPCRSGEINRFLKRQGPIHFRVKSEALFHIHPAKDKLHANRE